MRRSSLKATAATIPTRTEKDLDLSDAAFPLVAGPRPDKSRTQPSSKPLSSSQWQRLRIPAGSARMSTTRSTSSVARGGSTRARLRAAIPSGPRPGTSRPERPWRGQEEPASPDAGQGTWFQRALPEPSALLPLAPVDRGLWANAARIGRRLARAAHIALSCRTADRRARGRPRPEGQRHQPRAARFRDLQRSVRAPVLPALHAA